MKKVFLLIVLPALLLALGFAQTPAASINTDQTIKGCLAGSDGNYTVMEDNTGHIFKITSASVDFKQHLSHEVTLIGHTTTGASSAAADNSFAVTELTMISEHCAAVAAAPAATVIPPAETTVTPDAAAAAPAASTSSTVAETTSSTVAETAITPAVDTTASVETFAPLAERPAETASAPAMDAGAPAAIISTPLAPTADPTRLPATSRQLSAPPDAGATTPAVIASTSSETVSTPDAAAASPAAPASTSSETASTPDAAATIPAAPAKHGALFLLIMLAVLVIVIGTLVPFLGRWRKQKMLERTGVQNLSFTREASSDQDKPEQPRKAA